MNRARLARELVRAAMAFYDRALWDRLGNADVFAIVWPANAQPMFASVMGAGGQEFGLCLYRGEHALATVRAALHDKGHEAASAWDVLSLSMEPWQQIPSELLAILQEAGFAGATAPMFMAKAAGKRARAPRPAEQEVLLAALQGTLQADRQGLLRPTALAPSVSAAILTLRLSGDATNPSVTAKFEAHAMPVAAMLGPVLLPDDCRHLPRRSGHWLLGTPRIPGSIAGDERELRAVLIATADGDKILSLHATFEVAPAEVAAHLFDVVRGHNAMNQPGWPGRIDVNRADLHAALAPGLVEIGVQCDYHPELSMLDEIVATLAAQMAPTPERDPNVIPPSDDWGAWKQADRDLTDRLADCVRRTHAPSRELMQRYFGDQWQPGSEVDAAALDAFIDWLAFDYRVGRKETAADVLENDPSLPAATRALLQARMRADISLYRVEAVRPGEIGLLDLLSHESVLVHDHRASMSARENMVLFARVYPAGQYRFFVAISQNLGFRSEQACAWLEEQGLQLTRAGLRQASHLLGRLWHWLAEAAAQPLQVTNTDGDALLHVSASYEVKDAGDLRQRLLQRADIEEGTDEELVWFRAKGEERTLLGQLSFVGDGVTIEVNSEPRYERLHAILLRMPGVRATGVTRRAITDVPVDDRLPGDEPPHSPAEKTEIHAFLRQHLRQRMMQWLDEQIPALNGKTPRQAVRTLQGRRQVLRMIRTMPDPAGPDGPLRDAIPRDEMLRELGLAEDAME